MAAATKITTPFSGDIDIWKWTLTDADPTGVAVPLPRHSDLSIHVKGTFGTGGTITPQGSNELPAAADADFIALRDPSGTVIGITSTTTTNMKQILESVYWFRPKQTAGTGATLDVYLKAKRVR